MEEGVWNIILDFLSWAYHNGGLSLRWVLWIWMAFLFMYGLLRAYERINVSVEKPYAEIKNYRDSLHVFLMLCAILEYVVSKFVPTLYDFFHLSFIFQNINKDLISIKSAFIFVGFIFLVYGLLVTVWARLYLNGFWNKDIAIYKSSLDYNIPESLKPFKIIQTGPYKYYRHPIYFGQILMAFGTGLALFNFVVFIFALWIGRVNYTRAKKEEQNFQNEIDKNEELNFDSEWINNWKEYKRKTNMFSPGIVGFFIIIPDLIKLFLFSDKRFNNSQEE